MFSRKIEPTYSSDFAKALDCLRLYSCLLLDKDGNLIDDMSDGLYRKRYFTDHCDEVISVIKDYYGPKGYLTKAPNECTLAALENRLNSFSTVPENIDPKLSSRFSIIRWNIHLMTFREQLDEQLELLARSTDNSIVLQSTKLISLCNETNQYLKRNPFVNPLSTNCVKKLRNDVNTALAVQPIYFGYEIHTIERATRANFKSQFFPIIKGQTEQNLTFERSLTVMI